MFFYLLSLQLLNLLSNLSVSLLILTDLPCNAFLVPGVQLGHQPRDDRSVRLRPVHTHILRRRTRDLALLRVCAGSVRAVAILVCERCGVGTIRLDPFLHQRRVELFQSLRTQPIRVERSIFPDERVVAQGIGDGSEAGGPGVVGGEGLKEEEGFKGRIGRQRRHPPLPVEAATHKGFLGDGSHDAGGGPEREARRVDATEILVVARYASPLYSISRGMMGTRGDEKTRFPTVRNARRASDT
ncbi:hypothetical protein VTN77DRAFT_4878 [Rasamsonia byssochlamydoides]|uniref:uncharacterized protein n=1 Tax=Rasamsonia byssochlamydoides TaxID=89139 RepID=UPI0037444F6E